MNTIFNKMKNINFGKCRFYIWIWVCIFINSTLISALQIAKAQVSNYTFASSTGTYTPITGHGIMYGSWDDNYMAPITLPFNFNYNQIPFNTVSVNCNGYITFGNASNPSSNACGLQNTSCSFYSIAAYAADLQGSSVSNIMDTVIGTTPNRKFIVQWTDCDHYGNNNADHWSFQIVLYETTNVIQVIYGPCTTVNTMGANTCSYTSLESGDCGLLGGAYYDFNLRSVTNGTNTWATSAAGTTIADVCNMSPTNIPSLGLTYTWTPPAPTPMLYVSSTTNFVNNLITLGQNSINNKILQVQVVTSGSLSPISVSSLKLSTTGCNNPGVDLTNAKVYYTGMDNSFSTTNLFGTVSNPNGIYTVNGTATLNSSVNYFWVAYDVSPMAVYGDSLKGCCLQITGTGNMGIQVPTLSCPAGVQYINIPQGTWTPLNNLAPHQNGGVMMLLSDGTVICKTASGVDTYGNIWDRLTPDSHGSYVNGTWSQIASMINTRLYFSSKMMMDGRIYVAGGEYGSGGGAGEIYNPLTDSWNPLPSVGHTISDANSEILPNGKILQAMVTFDSSWNLAACKIYDPATNTYSPPVVAHGMHNESMWVKLPDNSIMYVDRDQTTSERYIPSLNQWVVDGNLPVSLYDPYGSETGPGFLLPDGRAFYIGATGHTAYYTPSGNNSPGTWAAGPDVPNAQGMPDAAGAMMVNGKILIAVSPVPINTDHFPPPTTFYVFDYLLNTFTLVNAPDGNINANISCYVTNMLVLPDGTILYSQQQQANSNQYYVFKPAGSPVAVGKPTIGSIIQTSCDSFKVTGTLFNGITEGAAYGDDSQNETNYPIVRITKDTNVYYCRSFNWNRTGVMTGNLADTTKFSLPANLPHGIYYLRVVANGNPSDSVQFIPFPILSSTQNPASICSGTTFIYSTTALPNGTTFTWTRPAVTGISNTAITIPQSGNPNEILVNTTSNPITVVYIYSLTHNGCSDTVNVSVTVNPVPTPSISANGATTFCQGSSVNLSTGIFSTYSWSNSNTSNSISVTASGTYIVTVTANNSCTATAAQVVVVNPLPVVSFNGLPDTICVNGGIRNLSGSPAGGSYSGSGITSNSFNPATANLGNDTIKYTYTDGNNCSNTFAHVVHVEICTGIDQFVETGNGFTIYPNPASGSATLLFLSNKKENVALRIMDVTGRIIFAETVSTSIGGNRFEMNLSGISQGVYLISLQRSEGILQSKLVVQ